MCYTVYVNDLIVPPEWSHIDPQQACGTVMIIGAPDTGKSMLARYLYQMWCRHGIRAAYLDADVGQSTLGAPTTMTLGMSAADGDEAFPPRGTRTTFFVGATSPRRHMLPMIVGAYCLHQKAQALGAKAIVVDTTGLVERTEGGKALKQWKIELLKPQLVIGLRRDRELESILWPLRHDGRVRCLEFGISPHVVARSREVRIERRRQALAQYLDASKALTVSLRTTAVYDLECLAPGGLLALQDAEGFVRALGVLESADHIGGAIVVRTPLSSLREVASIRFGTTRWDWVFKKEV